MMVAWLGIAATTFSFPGGSLVDLGQALDAALEEAVVIVNPEMTRIRAAKFSYENPAAFRQEVRSYFGFAVSETDAAGFAMRGFPGSVLLGEPLRGAGGIRVVDGKVTAEPVPGYFMSAAQVAQIAGVEGMDWFYGKVPVVVFAEDAPLETLGLSLSAAMGGRLVGTEFKRSWRSFRDRLAAGWDRLSGFPAPPADPAKVSAPLDRDGRAEGVNPAEMARRTQPARARIAAMAVRALSDPDLANLYRSPSETKSLRAEAGSSLASSAWSLVRDVVSIDPQRGIVPEGRLSDLVDPSVPIVVRLKAVGVPEVVITTRRGTTVVF